MKLIERKDILVKIENIKEEFGEVLDEIENNTEEKQFNLTYLQNVIDYFEKKIQNIPSDADVIFLTSNRNAD
jgi:hypothetical protein